MRIRRKMRKKPMRRPKKSEAARRRRIVEHRRRLVALGMPEEKVAKLDPRAVRDLVKYPVKTARDIAKSQA